MVVDITCCRYKQQMNSLLMKLLPVAYTQAQFMCSSLVTL